MKLLTWNIGSFVFQRYLSGIGNVDPERFEYYRPELNASLVSNTLKSIAPDIVFLQEFYVPEDIQSIKAIASFPYQYPIDTWYRNASAYVASKVPLKVSTMHGNTLLHHNDLVIAPVHLNSYSAKIRLSETRQLLDDVKNIDQLIIMGDTNMWIRNSINLFKYDRHAYSLLTEKLVDHSTTTSPSTRLGFGLDRIFTTSNIKLKSIKTLNIHGPYMDHLPVHFEIT